MSAARSTFTSFALTALLAGALGLYPPPILAAKKSSTEKAQSKRIKIQNVRSSSEETRAERDRRLYRECQGRPNAGACAGYTQKPSSARR